MLAVRVILGCAVFGVAAGGMTAMRGPAHTVVMHIESFTGQSVDVHLKATPLGLQIVSRTPSLTDTVSKAEVTVVTPADIRISSDVQTLELSTADNRAVKLQFGEGATDVEKRLRPWGRVLTFKRVNGNLQPSPKVMPVEPAH